jgi:drug/metabolite transporter (DMT)-like permease
LQKHTTMQVNTSRGVALGFAMALGAAIFWGISGTSAQYLFDHRAMDPAWLVSWRLMWSGLFLVLMQSLRKGNDLIKIWKKPSDAIQLLGFSIFGMVSVQYTYFYSINLSNAATATVLQYMGPILVVAFYALKKKRWPSKVEYLALALALGGTFLLVTHGSFSTLVISEKALIWGILSAFTLAAYTILPVQLLQQFSAASVTGWSMLIGGLLFSLYTQPWYVSGFWDTGTWLAFGYIIIFGTVIAFMIFLSSLNLIGAQTASLLCCVEPLSAALTAVLWLQVPFGGMDWLGTICILTTVVVLTLVQKKSKSPNPSPA